MLNRSYAIAPLNDATAANALATSNAPLVPLASRATAAGPALPASAKPEGEPLKPLIAEFIETLKTTMPAGLDQVLALVDSFPAENGQRAFPGIGRRHQAIAQAWSAAQSQQWSEREPIAAAWRKISQQHATMNLLIDQVFYQDDDDEKSQSAVYGQ